MIFLNTSGTTLKVPSISKNSDILKYDNVWTVVQTITRSESTILSEKTTVSPLLKYFDSSKRTKI
jgi:hypothetical protein